MPEKKSSDNQESQNWNSAKTYSFVKIMALLADLDKYENVARYGSTDLSEQLNLEFNPNIKNSYRLMGLDRFSKTMGMLIDNSEFALKRTAKDKLKEFREDLTKIDEAIGKIEQREYNARSKKTSLNINEDIFDNLIKILRNIKRKLNSLLNDAGLIFMPLEEFDYDKIKSDAMENISNQA